LEEGPQSPTGHGPDTARRPPNRTTAGDRQGGSRLQPRGSARVHTRAVPRVHRQRAPSSLRSRRAPRQRLGQRGGIVAASVPNAEVLERLLIEVVGDDSGLRQVLDEAVAYARQAAQAMRDALAVDLSKLQREAEGVTQSFNTAGAGLGDLSRQFQQQLGEMQTAFDKV